MIINGDGGCDGSCCSLYLRFGGHPALNVHSSNERGELSQRPGHNDSVIKSYRGIIIIIIINQVTGRLC